MREAQAYTDDTIALPWLWQALKRQFRWIAGGFVLGVLLGVAVILFTPPRYEAQAKILVESPAGMVASLGGLATLIGGGRCEHADRDSALAPAAGTDSPAVRS
jgi:uncharacterized protein involved in exopolysaccharide biosynthesis